MSSVPMFGVPGSLIFCVVAPNLKKQAFTFTAKLNIFQCHFRSCIQLFRHLGSCITIIITIYEGLHTLTVPATYVFLCIWHIKNR
jgi:hypothetical protein